MTMIMIMVMTTSMTTVITIGMRHPSASMFPISTLCGSDLLAGFSVPFCHCRVAGVHSVTSLGCGLAMILVGLAITMVSIGILAAAGAGFATSEFSSFDKWAEPLPIISSVIVMLLGLGITLRGLSSLGLL